MSNMMDNVLCMNLALYCNSSKSSIFLPVCLIHISLDPYLNFSHFFALPNTWLLTMCLQPVSTESLCCSLDFQLVQSQLCNAVDWQTPVLHSHSAVSQCTEILATMGWIPQRQQHWQPPFVFFTDALLQPTVATSSRWPLQHISLPLWDTVVFKYH